MEPTVIIHGWSDTSKSFRELAEIISQHYKTPPIIIRLADWISMHDDVSYNDISSAMQRAWQAYNLPITPYSVNIVVHSTGALITRDWMTTYYKPESVPIKRLVMLAPANFGSPLAHKGNSFIGRAIKGWNQPNFQTGNKILKGLELGSPYTFQLANRDLFDKSNRWFGKDRILCTILVGNTGYSGVSSIANEDGSDGTVRISTANLNAAKLTLELDEQQNVITSELERVNGSIAFAIVDDKNHSTIVPQKNSNAELKNLVIEALSVGDNTFSNTGTEFQWQTKLDGITSASTKSNICFQNTVTYLHDNSGEDVQDYFVEFYRRASSDKRFERQLYERFIESVHPYKYNSAFRSIYLNMDEFEKIKSEFSVNNLYVSLTANPLYTPPKLPVGYSTVASNATGGLQISQENLGAFFKPHRTLLVDIKINRIVNDQVFKLSSFV